MAYEVQGARVAHWLASRPIWSLVLSWREKKTPIGFSEGTYKVTAVELLLDLGGLGALAGTGGTDEDHADLLGGGGGLAAELAGLEGLDATLEGGNDIAEALNFVVDETHLECGGVLLGRSGDVC